ncbi:MAG: DUF1588 domain-containing protein [Opitutales bacterium]|nr:DUF1588 domain-containing protein [Opitutales bacterium]
MSLSANNGTPISDTHYELLSNYCLKCHDEVEMKGEVNLDHNSIDWGRAAERDLWENALHMLKEGLMPPEDEDQPSPEERETLMVWLDEKLLEHTPFGGTLPRRLSVSEYRTTIRDLFDLPDFELPVGFPKDSEYHGFNNVGEGLVLSPPLMESYAEVAGQIADLVYPPFQKVPPVSSRTARPNDMTISFSATTVVDDVLRIASRSQTIMRSCTWPSRIEIMASGTYRITITASTWRNKMDKAKLLQLHDPEKPDEPMRLQLRARELIASDRSDLDTFRLLEEFEFSNEDPKTYTFEADLYEGQTVLLSWANAEITHDTVELIDQFRTWFEREPRLLAAWQKAAFPTGDYQSPYSSTAPGNNGSLRGKSGWEIVKRLLADPDLDMSHATLDSEMTEALLRKRIRNVSFPDAMCHYFFENGPCLEFHEMTVQGPLKIVDGPKERLAKKLQKRFTGTREPGQTDEAFARQALVRFLPIAFRRPVDSRDIDTFHNIAKNHWAAGHSFDEGMHLVIRSILISPRFLYRLINPGEMDAYDLASRLSYFLTQGPPDEKLIELAAAGTLSNPEVLRSEAIRLLPNKAEDAMIQSFTSQWLDTRLLPGIMPDPVFKFTAGEIIIAEQEVEHFFTEMLTKNLPMTDFIDPNFHYTSPQFAKDNYQYPIEISYDDPWDRSKFEIQKLPLTRGGRFGGLLAQSAIMTATANGVDTQPVLRGVWVLENILGTPPPEPPKSVPALTPDIRGAKTPREMLAAHMADQACTGCHSRIDPIGFMLENFDPVGNWRERWPEVDSPIDSTGVLPDGTLINDITDFKAWLVDHIDLFSQCLSEKLMIYATGRVPNYLERHEIAQLVQENHERGNGFQDLLLSLITSDIFRTK